jgi:hypothetical protein
MRPTSAKPHPDFNIYRFLKMIRGEAARCHALAMNKAKDGYYGEAVVYESDADAIDWVADELEYQIENGKER